MNSGIICFCIKEWLIGTKQLAVRAGLVLDPESK